MVLFRHNLPQPTQAQLMRGEFPKTPCIEQGVVLSCRFAEWKVRRAPRVLRMAVVSQSSVKFGKKRVFLVGTINFMTIIAEVATSKNINNYFKCQKSIIKTSICTFIQTRSHAHTHTHVRAKRTKRGHMYTKQIQGSGVCHSFFLFFQFCLINIYKTLHLATPWITLSQELFNKPEEISLHNREGPNMLKNFAYYAFRILPTCFKICFEITQKQKNMLEICLKYARNMT